MGRVRRWAGVGVVIAGARARAAAWVVAVAWASAMPGAAGAAPLLPVTLDPSAAGLAGAAFVADTLHGREVSVLANSLAPDGQLLWHERGYLSITGASLGGAAVATPGLGSGYSLYVFFELAGVGDRATGGTVQWRGANGVSSFGYELLGAAPFVQAVVHDAAPAQRLADASLHAWSSQTTVVSLSPLALALSASFQALVAPQVAGLVDGGADPLWLEGRFTHPSSDVQVLGGGAVLLIQGGDDRLSFTAAVPEPGSAGLVLAGGLAAWGLARRQASSGRLGLKPAGGR